LKPNRITIVRAGDTLLAIAERYGTTVDTLRSLNSDIASTTLITTATGDTLNDLALLHGTSVSWLREQPANAWLLRPEGHTVTAGETLTSIAQLYGTTRTTLRKLNPTYADYREWPGDAPLPLAEVLNLFAIRPSSPCPLEKRWWCRSTGLPRLCPRGAGCSCRAAGRRPVLHRSRICEQAVLALMPGQPP
ncbi:MAG: LysM peptidoglycan-binding domain-containing protein, partial [Cyanobacteriota bacterium]